MDKHNAYRSAMARVQFDQRFEEKTLQRLAGEVQRRSRKRLVYCAAAAVCAATAIITVIAVQGTGKQQAAQQVAEASAPASPAAVATIETPAATAEPRVVVVSSEFGGSETDSYMSPGQGQVGFTEGVRLALEDDGNADSYFFVQIDIFPSESYANAFSDYVYNGRSIAEWRELIELANGTYPYGEYNGDHGGSVTEVQWRAAQEEAKTLDAQANCDAAIKKYNAEIAPMLAAAETACAESELARLQQLGYDVFFMDTWTYASAAEKEPLRIIAGILSAEQLNNFAADAQCGYFIDWVYNGDGVVDWDEALRP